MWSKKCFIFALAMVLVGAMSIGLARNVSASGGGVIEKIEGDDLPDDLTLVVDSEYTGEIQDGFSRFIYGDQYDEYVRDYNKMLEKSSECYNIDDDKMAELCFDEVGEMVADLYLKYKIIPISYNNVYLSTAGGAYEYEGDGISLNLNITDYDETIEMMMKGIEEDNLDITLEPFVVHKKHDGTYEYVDINYDLETNSMRFTTNELSTFLFGVMVIANEPEESPNTIDNVAKYIGLIAVSLIAFVSFGSHIRRVRR